jgi:hypothetical protein
MVKPPSALSIVRWYHLRLMADGRNIFGLNVETLFRHRRFGKPAQAGRRAITEMELSNAK